MADLWILYENQWPRFQKKSLGNFETIVGDLNPYGRWGEEESLPKPNSMHEF